jgi:hypothetical protein
MPRGAPCPDRSREVGIDDDTLERLKSRVPPRRMRLLHDDLLVRDSEYATALSRASGTSSTAWVDSNT